jgi:hypothetical protein
VSKQKALNPEQIAATSELLAFNTQLEGPKLQLITLKPEKKASAPEKITAGSKH